MDTKYDITNRQDIERMISAFYEKVKRDKTIGFIFTDLIPIDWSLHIPLITDFWETILLDNPVYKNNAMGEHYKINKIHPLKKEHFTAWVELFTETVDEFYAGPLAELAKKRAVAIAALMEHKMNETRDSSLL